MISFVYRVQYNIIIPVVNKRYAVLYLGFSYGGSTCLTKVAAVDAKYWYR